MTLRRVGSIALIAVPWFLAATSTTVVALGGWFDLVWRGGEASVFLVGVTAIALLLSFPLGLVALPVAGFLDGHLWLPVFLVGYAANSVLWTVVILKIRDYWRRRRASKLDDSQDEA